MAHFKGKGEMNPDRLGPQLTLFAPQDAVLRLSVVRARSRRREPEEGG